MSKDETTYPHVDETGRGMDDGTCKHCGVSGSLEGEECPVRLRRLIRRMERWQPYDEHGAPVTQAAYNALLSRQSTHEERVGVIARLTRERDDALARAEKAEAERDRLAAVLHDPELLRRLEEYRDALALLDSEPGPESATEHEGAALDLAAELLEVVDREGVTNG